MAAHSMHRQAKGAREGSRSRSRKRSEFGRSQHSEGIALRSDPNHNGSLSQEEVIANGLGLFGISLGLAEFMVPRRLARTIGFPPQRHRIIRAMGLREIASGVSILMQRAPAPAVWSRVAGDLIDLACLGVAFKSRHADRSRLAATTTAVVGATILDFLCAQQLSRGVRTRKGMRPVIVSLMINRSPEEIYRYWRNFSNFPNFMKHVKAVEMNGERRSHWAVTGPLGTTVEWDADITEDRPNELIAWRSVEGSDVHHSGQIRFEKAPADRGTMVTVEMHYGPPGGTLGSAVAAWFGDDAHQSIKMDLRRFKQVMETGEVITTAGQPAGRSRSTSAKYDAAVRH